MYRFIAFILIVCLCLPAYSEVLQGAVQESWTTNKARNEAFRGMPYNKNLRWAPTRDPYYKENMKAKKKNLTRIKNRNITFFSCGGYAVYEDNSINTFYFNDHGKLFSVGYDVGNNFPVKTYKYKYPQGNIYTVSIEVSKNNSYIFEPTGELIYHWVGNNCYDRRNKLYMTRYLVKY